LNPGERLNKRIEIAARISAAFINSPSSTRIEGGYGASNIGKLSLIFADAIIDTAIGDMTVEPK